MQGNSSYKTEIQKTENGDEEVLMLGWLTIF